MPAYAKGGLMEVVGIEDAAAAFLLAEEHGRPGERYIISEGFLSYKDLFDIASDEGGVPPPKLGMPHPMLWIMGVVGGGVSRVLRRDSVVTPTSVRLMHIQSELDHGKATRELGWQPNPTADSIRAGVRWWLAQRGNSRPA
jgi:dihydroflavonol-4-reductase